jgi:hypothetical protein
MAIGGGAVAGVGVVLFVVGASLWGAGTNDPPPVVSVGPGSVDVRWTF